MDWFLYDSGLRHERDRKTVIQKKTLPYLIFSWCKGREMARKQKSFIFVVVSKQRRQLKVINSNNSFDNNYDKSNNSNNDNNSN